MATTDPNESINVTQKLDFVEGNHELVPDTDGLTKREYFAGQVAAGLAASQDSDFRYPMDIANKAVKLADALINALNAKQI